MDDSFVDFVNSLRRQETAADANGSEGGKKIECFFFALEINKDKK